MPTEIELRVIRTLSAIEVADNAAETIEAWGNEAVTALCEIALGSFAGARNKVRTNAAGLLGSMRHPQARETLQMLVKDPNPDVSIRAIRATGRQQNTDAVKDLSLLLKKPDLSALFAAEVVSALKAIDSLEARGALQTYSTADPGQYPHRASPLVSSYLKGG
jgi:HEAT repeat protein